MQGTPDQSRKPERVGERLRALPSVAELSRALQHASDSGSVQPSAMANGAARSTSPAAATRIARRVLEHARASIHAGGDAPSLLQLRAAALQLMGEADTPALRPVINA